MIINLVSVKGTNIRGYFQFNVFGGHWQEDISTSIFLVAKANQIQIIIQIRVR